MSSSCESDDMVMQCSGPAIEWFTRDTDPRHGAESRGGQPIRAQGTVPELCPNFNVTSGYISEQCLCY